MIKASVFRIVFLTLLIINIVMISFLFHDGRATKWLNSTQKRLNSAHILPNAQGMYLEIPDTRWEPIFFEILERRTKKVGLSSLRTVPLPNNDLEMRLWIETFEDTINGFILRRSSGKWSAIYFHQVYGWKPLSIKLENLNPPISGWETTWTKLVSAGILALPDQSSNEKCKVQVLDGTGYVVETNINGRYRTFAYGNPEYAKCDEAKQFLLIKKIIEDEFNLATLRKESAAKVSEEINYWKMLDKTNLDELKAYVAKYPTGSYLHLAKANIKNIEAESLVETTSNTNNSNSASSSIGVAKPDPSVDRKITGEFVLIPAGNFTIGTNNHYSEQPAHEVIISKSFEMGKYEVTQGQWELVMGNNPSYFRGDKRLPVENVSWEDIQKFVSALNSKSRKYIYRLPTEAEWEYAARAKSKGDYAGNLDAMAWYANNSGEVRLNMTEDSLSFDKIESNICRTHPVGEKLPNAWGLYDMHGNVWEWCSDWYNNYSSGIVTDPSGAISGSGRVYRGGSWDCSDSRCRSAVRSSYSPDYHYYDVGFRLVRTLK